MRHFDHQRTFIAYHGCDESVVRRVLLTGDPLSASERLRLAGRWNLLLGVRTGVCLVCLCL